MHSEIGTNLGPATDRIRFRWCGRSTCSKGVLYIPMYFFDSMQFKPSIHSTTACRSLGPHQLMLEKICTHFDPDSLHRFLASSQSHLYIDSNECKLCEKQRQCKGFIELTKNTIIRVEVKHHLRLGGGRAAVRG